MKDTDFAKTKLASTHLATDSTDANVLTYATNVTEATIEGKIY